MPKARKPRGRWVPPASQVLQLKVTLQHCRPPIWRRLAVPDNLTLGHLHWIIQAAMGWTDSHLHAFEVGGSRFGPKGDGELAADDDQDEEASMLCTFKFRKGDTFSYEYDFGDGWMHTILVEKVEPAPEPHPRPRCLAGRRACPPEDCGGPWGYQDVLRVLRQAKDDDDRELREWVGDYDPERFDLEKVNRLLR